MYMNAKGAQIRFDAEKSIASLLLKQGEMIKKGLDPSPLDIAIQNQAQVLGRDADFRTKSGKRIVVKAENSAKLLERATKKAIQ